MQRDIMFIFENDSAREGSSERLRYDLPLGATLRNGGTWKALKFGKDGKGFEVKNNLKSLESAIFWIRRGN